jgi:hypothetical protein
MGVGLGISVFVSPGGACVFLGVLMAIPPLLDGMLKYISEYFIFTACIVMRVPIAVSLGQHTFASPSGMLVWAVPLAASCGTHGNSFTVAKTRHGTGQDQKGM